jgi:hypothetical protein
LKLPGAACGRVVGRLLKRSCSKRAHSGRCAICRTSPCLCSDAGIEPESLPDCDLDRFHRELEATGEASVLVRFEEDDDTACFLLSGKIIREH